jgi:folate-dependent phosphoribosylglycinamide formyltransferase PurN
MHDRIRVIHQPIRVVMFGGGPELTHDTKEFICRLDEHPEIEFLGAICQAEKPTLGTIFKDLWNRRGVLAFPLFVVRFFAGMMKYLENPQKEKALGKKLDDISDRIHNVKDIHAQDVKDLVQSFEPDLGLIYGSPILKPQLFEIPKFGTLGIHHGKVPAYRGNKTTFWAIYNGESVAGVTIQKINAGLDTGSIVKEGEVPIGRRSYQTVWRDLEALGLDLYIQAILEVKNGTATYRPQLGKKGQLYRNPKLKDFIVFWVRQTKKRYGKPQIRTG